MDPRDVANFFALVLLCGSMGVGIAVAIPASRIELGRAAPIVVGAVALGATLGSLYYSELADFVPCTYCWYQRIAMYPIAVIVAVALVLRDRRILWYTLALGSVGLAISLYHVQLQLFPAQAPNSCALTSPCTAKWVEAFGFMTIPQMAAISFALIVTVSIVGLRATPLAPEASLAESAS